MFLDEPTTGLDSFTATNVIEVLSDLARSGRTVVSTIHQPNSEIFEMFDQLMLIANGKTLYLNSAAKAVAYFKQVGYECPSLTNPADYFMNMMSIEAYEEPDWNSADDIKLRRSQIQQSYKDKINDLAVKYDKSDFKCEVDDLHPEIKGLANVRPTRFLHFMRIVHLDH